MNVSGQSGSGVYRGSSRRCRPCLTTDDWVSVPSKKGTHSHNPISISSCQNAPCCVWLRRDKEQINFISSSVAEQDPITITKYYALGGTLLGVEQDRPWQLTHTGTRKALLEGYQQWKSQSGLPVHGDAQNIRVDAFCAVFKSLTAGKDLLFLNLTTLAASQGQSNSWRASIILQSFWEGLLWSVRAAGRSKCGLRLIPSFNEGACRIKTRTK